MLKVQLEFEDPLSISQYEVYDQLRISMYKPYFLTPDRLSDEQSEELESFTRSNGAMNEILWADIPR